MLTLGMQIMQRGWKALLVQGGTRFFTPCCCLLGVEEEDEREDPGPLSWLTSLHPCVRCGF